MRLEIKKGEKYNKLTVVKEVQPEFEKNGKKRRVFLFKCDCGNYKEIELNRVRRGNTKSCGCLSKEKAMPITITHGMSKSKVYAVWCSLKKRCNNKNSQSYKDYGGRGIEVCDRWHKFEHFYEDMGDNPKGLSIDRIDNNGDYRPENCRWATRGEQQRNTRNSRFLTFNGETKCLADWAKQLGIDGHTLRRRLNNSAWSIKKALTTKGKTHKKTWLV